MKKQIRYYVIVNRVSSKKQAYVNNGSLVQQGHISSRYLKKLKKNNPHITYVLHSVINEDQSGMRGSLGKRKEMLEILDLIAMGKIQDVVFEKVDRISRDQVFNLQLVHLAEEHGCIIHDTEGGPIDFSDRFSRQRFNYENMKAEEYSLDLSEKKRRKNREAMVNSGKDVSTNLILGIDAHPTKSCMYIHNKKEIKQVLEICQNFVKTESKKETLDFCKERGYKTKVKYTKEKNDEDGNKVPSMRKGGDVFTAKSLDAILCSRKLRGFSFFQDDLNQFPEKQDGDGCVRWDYSHDAIIPLDLGDRIDNV